MRPPLPLAISVPTPFFPCSYLAISSLFTAIERKLSRGILRIAVSKQPKEPTTRYQEHSRQSDQRFAPTSKGVNKEMD